MRVKRRPLDSRLRGNDGAEARNDGGRSGNDGVEPGTEVGGLMIRGSQWRQIKQNIDVLALLLGLYLWYRIGAKLGLDTNSLRIGG